MCGIVCYLGNKPAVPILIDGLRRLEYRGYDSSGIAVFDRTEIQCRRSVGKVQLLEQSVSGLAPESTMGIAHTRWATHGPPTLENAHPQMGCNGDIYLVHNGIIENYRDLKTDLLEAGHRFSSETDTEVLCHLVEEYLTRDLLETVQRVLHHVEGAFGIGLISSRHPRQIIAARRGSPLIIGVGENETFVASDVAALVHHTKEVVYLEDEDIAAITPQGYRITHLKSGRILRSSQVVDWDFTEAEKQGFPHFMLKEIHEEPEAVRNALRGRILEAGGVSKLGGLEPVLEPLRNMRRLIIVSCGTSYFAGLLGRYIIESCTHLAVEAELASEFRYRKLNLAPDTVVLAISQSGETADTLAAVQEAKRKGVVVLGLVNVVGSNIARETMAGIYNHAGPEISVASTKAFLSQLTILYLISLLLARQRQMSLSEGQSFLKELQEIPQKIEQILAQKKQIEAVARRYARYQNFFYIGRKFNYPVGLEGALKLKELSYIHAEGYAAGEMKHGPIALIDENFPSVCIAPRDSAYEKILSNIQEIKARKGPIIGITDSSEGEMDALCDDLLVIPATAELFTPLLTIIPLQLFAYYVARERGCEIDQPRNLAKSVTVE